MIIIIININNKWISNNDDNKNNNDNNNNNNNNNSYISDISERLPESTHISQRRLEYFLVKIVRN